MRGVMLDYVTFIIQICSHSQAGVQSINIVFITILNIKEVEYLSLIQTVVLRINPKYYKFLLF